jgi:AhpC/TSA family
MIPTRRSLTMGVLVAVLLALAGAGAAGALEVGQQAPDFSLVGPEGKPIKLSELTAKGPVVLYTFIAAFTPT